MYHTISIKLLRKQATRKAITQHERNKVALRKFNEKWQLFKALPFHDDPQTKHDSETTSRHSETRTALATPHADRESPRRRTRSQRSAHTETEGASRPMQETSPAAANG